MRNKRKGIDISTRTFRVMPDDIVRMWWTRELDATELMLWLSLQLIAVEKGRVTFNEIHRICGVSREKLSKSLKKLIAKGLLVRSEQGFIVMFNSEPSGSPGELGGSPDEPSGSPGELGGSPDEPSGSPGELGGSPGEPLLSSNRPREIKRDIESHGESPTPRRVEMNGSVSDCRGVASADSFSHINISEADLAVLAHRYGIDCSSISNSPAARVAIRALLSGDESKKEFALALLQVLAARGDAEFAGAGGSAPAK